MYTLDTAYGTSRMYLPTYQREQHMLPKKPSSKVLKAAMVELSATQDDDVPMVAVKGKRPRFEPDPNQAENKRKAVKFPIGGDRFATVKAFKGVSYVNI